MTSDRTNPPNDVDLSEVQRLVDSLESDLKKVREGSSDLATLRGEVEQLRALLSAPGTGQSQVHEGLHGVRAVLHRVEQEVIGEALTASDYINRIGRMLGM